MTCRFVVGTGLNWDIGSETALNPNSVLSRSGPNLYIVSIPYRKTSVGRNIGVTVLLMSEERYYSTDHPYC